MLCQGGVLLVSFSDVVSGHERRRLKGLGTMKRC